MAKQLTMWQTQDGNYFTDEESAVEHERGANPVKKLAEKLEFSYALKGLDVDCLALAYELCEAFSIKEKAE